MVYDGLGAGGGIAVQYLCLAQADPSSGLWPILTGRAAAIAAVLLAAVTFLRHGGPRAATTKSPTAFSFSVGSGVLAAGALAATILIAMA